jgi:hypothetical protein
MFGPYYFTIVTMVGCGTMDINKRDGVVVVVAVLAPCGFAPTKLRGLNTVNYVH